MKINISASWIKDGNLSGPVELLVKVVNNTSVEYVIEKICIQLKYHNILKKDKEVMCTNRNDKLKSNTNFEFSFAITNIQNMYGYNQKFAIKIFTDKGSFYSNETTVRSLNELKDRF